ncbi:MAG: amidohydrolase family protein [Brevundimonas sp.]|uniref:amidohydrolase family protein n=1 Tax=Brevundimonas sp. TaxID=1871086 RepID=UPI00273267CF|nr:amidohydrolase family protein [Brevundimonas sp.]MDP3657020.1 amidohydrolase family protein [Brevundimonas sp.]MDZ4109405.1 amidohydrolase family protein [Brevundimonas sp.]
MYRLVASVGVAAVLALAAPGMTQTAAPAATGPVTLIQAGRLLDRPGQAPRGPSTVVVRDGLIVEIRDGFIDASAFPGATVIDQRDRFVLPGLIDSHVHLVSDLGGQAGFLSGITDNLPTHAYRAADNARKTLMAGFTTVRNLGDDGGVTLALADATAAHRMPGPRIIDAGTSISTTSGHMDGRLGLNDDLREVTPHDNVCNGPESCREAVRIQVGRGARVIKIATTGGVNSRIGAGLGAQMFEDEARALIETAHLYGLKVAVHAHGADGVNLALRLGADSIEHGTIFDDETLRLFRQSGAYYVPTLSTVNGYIERLAADPNAYPPEVLPKIRWRIEITGQSLQRAVPAGVRIAFGTDAGVSKHGRNADEFALMVQHGMTPMAAIQAATVNAADLLGLSSEIGTLEPGKRADIVAVDGDPLTDVTVLTSMDFVMRDGRVYRDGE